MYQAATIVQCLHVLRPSYYTASVGRPSSTTQLDIGPPYFENFFQKGLVSAERPRRIKTHPEGVADSTSNIQSGVGH